MPGMACGFCWLRDPAKQMQYGPVQRSGLDRKAQQQQVADRMNVLFQRTNGFEEQVGNRLPVYLHEIGDLFIVHAFEVFEENGFFLAAGQFLDRATDFYLVFIQQFLPLNFCFHGLVIGKLTGFVDIQKGMGTVVAAELLHKLVTQRPEKVDGNKLDLNVLAPFPDMNHQVLDSILDEFPISRKITGVVKKRAVLFIDQLAKRQTVPGLALLPEI